MAERNCNSLGLSDDLKAKPDEPTITFEGKVALSIVLFSISLFVGIVSTAVAIAGGLWLAKCMGVS